MEPTNLTIEIVKQIRDEVREMRTSHGAQLEDLRGEIRELRQDTAAGFRDLRAEIGSVRSDLRAEIGSVRSDLRAEIGALRQETAAHFDHHGKAIVKLIHEVHGINDRIDNFLHGAHGDDHADLRARVARLEEKVGE